MAGITVVDYDRTRQRWVVGELGATDLFNQLLPTIPWNSLMDKMIKEVHGQGNYIEDIKEVLRRAPIHTRIVPAINQDHALGCDLRVLFIETILDHLGIKECFSEITANSRNVDEG